MAALARVSSEITSSTPRKPSRLQGAEQLVVGRLALGVGHLHGEDLPQPVGVAHRRDDQNALAHHPPIHPGLLVAGIHEQVGVGLRLQRAIPPCCELRVQGARPGKRRGSWRRRCRTSSSVISLTFLVETPSTYISIKRQTRTPSRCVGNGRKGASRRCPPGPGGRAGSACPPWSSSVLGLWPLRWPVRVALRS